MKTIASQGLKQCEDIRGQPSTDEIVFKRYQCEIKKFIMYNLLLKLWKNYDIFWVSVYIAFASLLSLISVYFLTETYKRNLND